MAKNEHDKPEQSSPEVVPDRSPAQAPTPARTPDANWGRGGSYVRDPTTGERRLIQRTRS